MKCDAWHTRWYTQRPRKRENGPRRAILNILRRWHSVRKENSPHLPHLIIMFAADPHPAEDSVLAVHETYSRTILWASGVENPAVRKRPDRDFTSIQIADRSATPKRALMHVDAQPRTRRAGYGDLPPIVAVVGANGKSREHLLSARIADCLAARDLRVAVTRLTGSQRTVFTESCHWTSTRDMADYGYSSTRACDQRQLSDLFRVQMQDFSACEPDVVVVELCGTLWRQDVRSMLSIIGRSGAATGAVLSASAPGPAALGVDMINASGIPVAALWSPCADTAVLRRDSRMRKLALPVCGRGEDAKVARALMSELRRGWLPLSNAILHTNSSGMMATAAA